MKTITITINENGAVNFTAESFMNDFEINGLLQTVLMHRVCNQFGMSAQQPTLDNDGAVSVALDVQV